MRCVISEPGCGSTALSCGAVTTGRAAARPLLVAVLVTALVTALSYFAPIDYASTLVGAAFLGAAYFLVLRHDDQVIAAHGLELGGVFERGPISVTRVVRATLRAFGWALLLSLIFLPPFLIGYGIWFSPQRSLEFVPGADPLEEISGHVFAVALPEEVFYRGYLQSALDRVWPPNVNVLGAKVGLGLLVASVIFAIGHLLTTPNPSRLAVFFPSLLFGWLRARTGGVGASVLFHAMCNLFSAYLARGYGFAQ